MQRVRLYLATTGAVAILVGGPVAFNRLTDAPATTPRATGMAAARIDHGSATTAASTPTTTTVVPTTTSTPPSTAPPASTPAPNASPGSAAPAPATGGQTTAAAANDWRLVASDEFDGPSLDTGRWEVYNGAGNGGVGLRRPSAISQAGGELRITGRGDVSGGISWRGGRTYGRWEVRARIDHGNGYAPAILLWPSSNNWPAEGEIDLTEVPNGDRQASHFTLHWGSQNSQDGVQSSGDFSQWHTFAVEWQPDHVTAFVDGRAVYTNNDPAAIPRHLMQLALQNDVGPYGWIPARDAATPPEVTLHIDWARIYAP
jgi:beta-glucanase (GH16 family)